MLEKLKLMLGFSNTEDAELLQKLQWLIDTAAQRLQILLGGVEEVPEELEYIVVEVAIIRYNRIASEGMTANTVEGESLTWGTDDFDGFKDDIDAWLENQEDGSGKGKVRFL